jgi:hypothetical protein
MPREYRSPTVADGRDDSERSTPKEVRQAAVVKKRVGIGVR